MEDARTIALWEMAGEKAKELGFSLYSNGHNLSLEANDKLVYSSATLAEIDAFLCGVEIGREKSKRG